MEFNSFRGNGARWFQYKKMAVIPDVQDVSNLSRSISSSFISLIPKTHPLIFNEFTPINLVAST